MTTLALLAALLAQAPADDAPAETRPTLIVVLGAPGDEEYGQQFTTWADRWQSAARDHATHIEIGRAPTSSPPLSPSPPLPVAGEPPDREKLKAALSTLADKKPSALFLVLIGHGTFDGKHAKFNLNGPDVSADELAEWLKPLEMPLAVVNCASSSGPFINRLSSPGRVVVTAAKSGYELNFARFGDYLSKAIGDAAVDLDKDGQTSLLEAFLAASAGTAEFYEQEGRLATEHALLDDNGDALGTPADWFRGFRAVRTAKEGALPDGARANQFFLIPAPAERSMPPAALARRDALESTLATLRRDRATMPESEYLNRLEPLLLELARLYRELDSTATDPSNCR